MDISSKYVFLVDQPLLDGLHQPCSVLLQLRISHFELAELFCQAYGLGVIDRKGHL